MKDLTDTFLIYHQKLWPVVQDLKEITEQNENVLGYRTGAKVDWTEKCGVITLWNTLKEYVVKMAKSMLGSIIFIVLWMNRIYLYPTWI